METVERLGFHRSWVSRGRKMDEDYLGFDVRWRTKWREGEKFKCCLFVCWFFFLFSHIRKLIIGGLVAKGRTFFYIKKIHQLRVRESLNSFENMILIWNTKRVFVYLLLNFIFYLGLLSCVSLSCEKSSLVVLMKSFSFIENWKMVSKPNYYFKSLSNLRLN